MVSAITQALLQRTATVRKLVQQAQGDNPASAQSIAQFDEHAKQALDAIDKIERSKVDVVKQRKALAKERLAQLKDQLRVLRMMGGNSEAMARQAAALAREIAAAVRSYGGSDGGALGADASTCEQGATDGGGEGDTASGDGGAETAIAAGDATPSDTAAATEKTDAPAAPQPAQPNEHTAATGNNASDRDEDRRFFQDVRNVLQQIRRIIEDAKHQHGVKHAKASPIFAAALKTVGNADATVTEVAEIVLSTPAVAPTTQSVRISI
jgi:hypothetical protein